MVGGALATAELYASILGVHPYDDGNGRVAFVALQAALLSQGMHAITFDDLRRHDEALGPRSATTPSATPGRWRGSSSSES